MSARGAGIVAWLELGARIERRMIGLVGFLLGAVLWRAPAMLFIDLNWDEALYRLIGASVLGGEMPYVGIWDRKPVGLFLIHAAAQAMPVNPVLATRLAASLAVGAGAYCLAGIARMLFAPMLRGSGRLIGGIAGVLYILFSVRNGGNGVNSELFFGPLNIAGLWLLLQAVGREGRAGTVLGGVAGALLGAALQVKYNALFEWPAFVVAAALVWPSWRRPIWRDPVTLAAVAGLVMPSVAVLLWFAGAGRWEDWVGANIAANGGLLTGDAPLGLAGVPFLLRQVAPLVVGAALAVPAAMLPGSAVSRRGLLVVLLWLAGAVLALLALRRFADHMMLQVLAPMALASAFGVVRLGAALTRLGWLPVGRWRIGLAIGAALLIGVSVGPGLAQPFVVAMEVLMRRHGGAAHWGDPSATVGAGLRERLRPGERIFVFGGPILGVYQAAGQRPPTRFAFVPHLWAGYAPVDGAREIAAILAQRPAFIVVAQAWQPGQTLAIKEGAAIFARVHEALAESYVQDGMVGRFVSWGGGAIGPREGIVVYRRADRPM